MAMAAQDKYTVTVPGGLAFSEFRGYENWQSVSVSKTEHAFAIILANPVMIEAYRSGIPGNGKPFPEGSKIAKMHYNPVKSADAPDPTTEVPGTLLNVDFIEKDSKRFTDSDSGGWGYAAFNYNARVRYLHPCYRERHAAAVQRRQMRGRVSHDRAGKGPHVYGVSEAISEAGRRRMWPAWCT